MSKQTIQLALAALLLSGLTSCCLCRGNKHDEHAEEQSMTAQPVAEENLQLKEEAPEPEPEKSEEAAKTEENSVDEGF